MTQIIILPDEMHIVDQLAAVRKSLEQLKGLERLLVVGVRAEMRNNNCAAVCGRYAIASHDLNAGEIVVRAIAGATNG
jgi:hypothetical protein